MLDFRPRRLDETVFFDARRPRRYHSRQTIQTCRSNKRDVVTHASKRRSFHYTAKCNSEEAPAKFSLLITNTGLGVRLAGSVWSSRRRQRRNHVAQCSRKSVQVRGHVGQPRQEAKVSLPATTTQIARVRPHSRSQKLCRGYLNLVVYCIYFPLSTSSELKTPYYTTVGSLICLLLGTLLYEQPHAAAVGTYVLLACRFFPGTMDNHTRPHCLSVVEAKCRLQVTL